jgi:hypothetical protein
VKKEGGQKDKEVNKARNFAEKGQQKRKKRGQKKGEENKARNLVNVEKGQD